MKVLLLAITFYSLVTNSICCQTILTKEDSLILKDLNNRQVINYNSILFSNRVKVTDTLKKRINEIAFCKWSVRDIDLTATESYRERYKIQNIRDTQDYKYYRANFNYLLKSHPFNKKFLILLCFKNFDIIKDSINSKINDSIYDNENTIKIILARNGNTTYQTLFNNTFKLQLADIYNKRDRSLKLFLECFKEKLFYINDAIESSYFNNLLDTSFILTSTFATSDGKLIVKKSFGCESVVNLFRFYLPDSIAFKKKLQETIRNYHNDFNSDQNDIFTRYSQVYQIDAEDILLLKQYLSANSVFLKPLNDFVKSLNCLF